MRRCEGMGKLAFGMMQSLDGYVAGAAGGPGSDGYVAGVAGGLDLPPPGVSLYRHLNDLFRGVTGCLYGRRMYEVMRYWDEDQPDWEEVEHDFAAVWRGGAERGGGTPPHVGWAGGARPGGGGAARAGGAGGGGWC